jgi:hypothetical protein
MSWPQTGCAPPPKTLVNLRARVAGFAGAVLIMAGIVAVAVAIGAQVHAPRPSLAAAGALGPLGGHGPRLRPSRPVSVDIPAIGVLATRAGEAAWYKYSATPGEIGTSVIEGHVDSYQGPAVFFRLGALIPGDRVDVTLADGITAVFRVTGVREYTKSRFPSKTIYGAAGYAALHLITCGGAFDYSTGHYLSSTVVFASLTSSHRAHRAGG